MTISRRTIVAAGSVGAIAFGAASSALANSHMDKPGQLPPVPQADGKTLLTADQALARLKEGNRRFVADMPVAADISNRRRMAIAQGQAPFASIIACADSRVGPEQLFGAGLGELFVIRTAGNTIDTAGMGSLEFGAGVLGAPLIVVVGHERCGAVKAAADVVKTNAKLPGSLGPMVEPIVPAVLQAKTDLKGGGDLVEDAGHANVKRVVADLRGTSSPVIGEMIRSGKIKVVGAYYDLDTGTVDFFDV